MPQIFDVTANENARYKRNELELAVMKQFIAVGPQAVAQNCLLPWQEG